MFPHPLLHLLLFFVLLIIYGIGRKRDQWNRIESPEINTHIDGQLILSKGAKNIQSKKEFFSINGFGKTGMVPMKERKEMKEREKERKKERKKESKKERKKERKKKERRN